VKLADYCASLLLNCDDITFNSRASLPFLTYSIVRKMANMASIRMTAVTVSSLRALRLNSSLSKGNYFAKEIATGVFPADSFAFRSSLQPFTFRSERRKRRQTPSSEIQLIS